LNGDISSASSTADRDGPECTADDDRRGDALPAHVDAEGGYALRGCDV
jgi:hypothetical protein